MTLFRGFAPEVFECCERSAKIRVTIGALKELRLDIEPELRKINPALIGHVSKTKKKGTNEYNDWAWLYFNTIGTEAYRYSQLTVNISSKRLYAGVNIRTSSEYVTFRKEINKNENNLLLEEILRSLSGREWIIPFDDDWEVTPRRYSPEELRGMLLDPRLCWINACFEKNEPLLKTSAIVDEIVQIFKELYNIYAFASSNGTITQRGPKYGVYEEETVVESAESSPQSDEDILLGVKQFLSALRTSNEGESYHLPGKRDQYSIKRTALEFNLKPYELDSEGRTITIYSDKDIASGAPLILRNYPKFTKQLDHVRSLLYLPEDFIKVMFVDPKSDGRYQKMRETSSIFLNIARFDQNKDQFFWLFTVARELAYIKTHRLGYPFINQLRDILTVALINLKNSTVIHNI
jgi:hypothetical protein